MECKKGHTFGAASNDYNFWGGPWSICIEMQILFSICCIHIVMWDKGPKIAISDYEKKHLLRNAKPRVPPMGFIEAQDVAEPSSKRARLEDDASRQQQE